MDTKDLQFIQNQIGYNFRNSDLLQQAFVRRSYAQENGGGDNEVLEFIGDKVLDIAVVRYLTEKYGYVSGDNEDFDAENECDEFFCDMSEGDLTDIKQTLVEKEMLSHRIDVLDFADFLIMGNGDVMNNINHEKSVKDDLFEAILGAVAIDSGWNFDELQGVVGVMLDPDSELEGAEEMNYVRLVHEWTDEHSGCVPHFYYEEASYHSSLYIPFSGVTQKLSHDEDNHDMQFRCYMKIGEDYPIFRGFGVSKSRARIAVCEVAYDYLEENNLLRSIRAEIEKPGRDEAINQLETLARRGYFSIPEYTYIKEYDDNGNPVWSCECSIEEYDFTSGSRASSKKAAKKDSAFAMLRKVLG